MSNIYAKNKKYDKMDDIRNDMKNFGIKKKIGISWIDIDGKITKFASN